MRKNIVSVLLVVLTLLLSEYYSVILSALLTREQIGRIAYLITVASLLKITSVLGMDTLVVKSVSRFNVRAGVQADVQADPVLSGRSPSQSDVQADPRSPSSPALQANPRSASQTTARNYLAESLLVAFGLFLVGALVVFLLGFSDAVLNARVMLLVLFPSAVLYQMGGYMQGAKRFALSAFAKRAFIPSFALAYVLFTFLSGAEFSFDSLLARLALFTVLFVAVLLPLVRFQRPSLRSLCTGVKKGYKFLVFNTFFTVMAVSDSLIIRSLLGYEALGNYAVILGITSLIPIGLRIANVYTPTLFSQNFGNRERINAVGYASSVFATLVACVVIAVSCVALVAQGQVQELNIAALLCLALAQFVNVLAGSCGFLCNMTGLEAFSARSAIQASAINIVVSLALTPLWGIAGAALGTSLAIIFNNINCMRIAYTTNGVKSSFLLAPLKGRD